MAGLFYSLPLSSNWLQPHTSQDQEELKRCLQCLYEEKNPLVIFADENCGKSLLLFQAAIGYASQDYHVTFISRRPLTQMPLSVHGSVRPETAGQLKTLTFLYMSKVADLIEHCSAIHFKPVPCDVLIVDDLDFYINQLMEPDLDVGCARLCAVLKDTQAYLVSKRGTGVLMMGCRTCCSQVKHVLPQFSFTLADVTVVDSRKRLYRLAMASQSVSVSLTYSIEEIGLYLRDVSLTCNQKVDTFTTK